MIETNQDLYCTAHTANGYAILKMSADLFAGHAGDILFTKEEAKLLSMVHWNAGTTNFVVTQIPIPSYVSGFEHVTFAPLDIPGVSPSVTP